MMVVVAVSGEVLRFVDCLGSPLASSSYGTSVAGRHGEKGSAWQRKMVSGKQRQTVYVSRRYLVENSSERTTLGSTCTLSTTTAASARETRRRKVAAAPRRAVQANVTTIVPEGSVGSDEAVEETMALARAAAKAARDAARDAAAYAEAQALGDDSFQVFPSEQDLLLLERARLTEMARSGAVQVCSPEKESDRAPTSPWENWDFSPPTGVDAGLELGVSSLERGLLQQQQQRDDDKEDEDRTGGDTVTESRNDSVTVRSNRRRERMLKRERALMRADVAAATVSSSTPLKARKPQLPQESSSDPVRAYLRDVGKTKLLTAAEEAGLAEGIQDLLRMESVKANLMEQMGREPSALEWAKAIGAEHQSLESRIKSGQACKDKMVNSNLRLVVSIAKRYQNRGMAIQDLIQEGSMGLIRGAEKFDHTRGFKFSTYAHWWIRQAITRAIADQSRTIRLPVHVYELLSRITKAKSMLAAEHGRVPRDEEIAELVGLNIEKLKLVVKSARTPKSMEFPVGKNNDTMLGEVIPDRDVESPEEAISKRLLKQDLDVVLNTLNPRERDVLRLRYGLNDGRMRTLEEIGNVFSVTRERIRQIEAKALRKLRQPSRNTSLREYLDLKA